MRRNIVPQDDVDMWRVTLLGLAIFGVWEFAEFLKGQGLIP